MSSVAHEAGSNSIRGQTDYTVWAEYGYKSCPTKYNPQRKVELSFDFELDSRQTTPFSNLILEFPSFKDGQSRVSSTYTEGSAFSSHHIFFL